MPLNTWICSELCGTNMFIITCIFFGSCSLPSFEIINLINIPKKTVKVHFYGFKLIFYSLHFWKHNLSFCKWVSMPQYIVKSSKNIFMKLSKYSLNAFVTTLWNVGGPFFIPKNITVQINTPQSVISVVLYLSSKTMDIWGDP